MASCQTCKLVQRGEWESDNLPDWPRYDPPGKVDESKLIEKSKFFPDEIMSIHSESGKNQAKPLNIMEVGKMPEAGSMPENGVNNKADWVLDHQPCTFKDDEIETMRKHKAEREEILKQLKEDSEFFSERKDNDAEDDDDDMQGMPTFRQTMEEALVPNENEYDNKQRLVIELERRPLTPEPSLKENSEFFPEKEVFLRHEKVNEIHLGTVKTERFGEAEASFRLIEISGKSDSLVYPDKKIAREEKNWLINKALRTIKYSNIEIQNLDRFKEIAHISAIYTLYQNPDLGHLDLRTLGTYYFHLGFGLQMESYKWKDYVDLEEADCKAKIQRCKKMNQLLKRVLKQERIKPEEIEEIEFDERDAIIHCFKMFTKYIVQLNENYSRHNKNFLKELQFVYDTKDWAIDIALRLSKKALKDRELYSETNNKYVRANEIRAGLMMQIQFLIYDVYLDDETLLHPEFEIMIDFCKEICAYAEDICEFSNDYDFENDYEGEKLVNVMNIIVNKLLDTSIYQNEIVENLKEAFAWMEDKYNELADDIVNLGEFCIVQRPGEDTFVKFVKIHRWVCTAFLKTHLDILKIRGLDDSTYIGED